MVLAPLLGSAGFARPRSQKDEKAIAEEFRAFAKREAAAYTFRLEGSDRPLRLHPEPVLSWSDPVVGASLRRRLHLDGRRAAGGRGLDLQVLLAGPPPGQRVPLAGAGQADRRARRGRRLDPLPAAGWS